MRKVAHLKDTDHHHNVIQVIVYPEYINAYHMHCIIEPMVNTWIWEVLRRLMSFLVEQPASYLGLPVLFNVARQKKTGRPGQSGDAFRDAVVDPLPIAHAVSQRTSRGAAYATLRYNYN